MIKMIPGKMVTFAVLFLLVRVVCTQECSTCQCCADGYHPKCSSRGYCNNGCIDGKYHTGFRKRNAYIAALGPMAKQLGDFGQFWRMVWQQKVEKIVMVTHFVEGEGKHNFEERNLHHLQFTAWPDKDIPDDVTSMSLDRK
ncbi:PTPRS-like protein [Mya arenaria]|uniref:PTPRS-like protein n=1 Tax=Mya arenaria TaxID=6604 RepID=A0ABY7F7Q4_MYAAR|nr:PTPRS-like protein [Mya arenaria]